MKNSILRESEYGNRQECPLENVLDEMSPDFGPSKNVL